jgi:hypothetical protein
MNHQVPEYLLALTLTRALNKDTLYDGPARLSPFIGSLVPRVNSSSKGTRVIRPPALAHSEDVCRGYSETNGRRASKWTTGLCFCGVQTNDARHGHRRRRPVLRRR